MNGNEFGRREALATFALAGGTGVLGAQSIGGSPLDPVEGNWPLGRGDPANTGVAGGAGPRGQVTARWTFEEHLVARKPPVVADGRLYVGTFDERASFVALDAATGSEEWRTDLGDGIDVRFPESAAAIADDVVLAAFGSVLVGFDPTTGEIRWRRRLGDQLRAPVVADGTAYVSVGETGTVVALDPSTGDPSWRRPVGGWVPATVGVAEGTCFAVANRDEAGSLVALDGDTGDRHWTHGFDRRLATPPVIADGTVFVADAAGLHALSVDGSYRFRFDFEAPSDAEVDNWPYGGSAPAVADGTVYVGAPDARVYAVDAKTGERAWAFWSWNAASGSPVVAGDTVYVASDDTFVYGLDAVDGTRRWEFDTTGPVQGAGGAVIDGMLFVSTWQDGLYALEGA